MPNLSFWYQMCVEPDNGVVGCAPYVTELRGGSEGAHAKSLTPCAPFVFSIEDLMVGWICIAMPHDSSLFLIHIYTCVPLKLTT